MNTDERPAERPRHKRLPSGFTTLRDGATFLLGMAIIVNEVFLSSKVEPAAVAIGAALSGLPWVFGADERRKAAPQEPKP